MRGSASCATPPLSAAARVEASCFDICSREFGSDCLTRGRCLTQVDLAKAVQSSQSRVAKMEAGDPSVSLDLLVRSLIALGTSSKELGKIISLSRVRPAT